MTSQAEATWYPDPTGRHPMRFFDGTAWTSHVSDSGVTVQDDIADRAYSQGDMPTPNDTVTLWEGERNSLTSAATGAVSGRYRLTRDALHFESGLLTTRAEFVPLWAITDVDLT